MTNNYFSPSPARPIAIIQLCFGLGALLWILFYPFMGAHYLAKSRLLEIEQAIGIEGELSSLIDTEGLRPKLERNALRFQSLQKTETHPILIKYEEVKKNLGETFVQKLRKTLYLLLVVIPPFELVWIILSITIPILLLLKIEGAPQAAWLLPLVSLFFALDSYSHGVNPYSEKNFYPSEKLLVFEYLKSPLGSTLKEQKEQLLKGWQLYLIDVWGNQKPKNDPQEFNLQFEAAEFLFNLNRIKSNPYSPYYQRFREKHEPGTLLLFLSWNLFFAFQVYRKTQLRILRKVS